jgi:hypothetical protein
MCVGYKDIRSNTCPDGWTQGEEGPIRAREPQKLRLQRVIYPLAHEIQIMYGVTGKRWLPEQLGTVARRVREL